VEVAKAWEEAFFSTSTPHTRKVAIRSAMTFSPDRGGVFDVLSTLVRRGLGGAQGPGTQYVSWIHEIDFIRSIEFLIEREDISGVVNLAAPNPVMNRDFMQILRKPGVSAWARRARMAARDRSHLHAHGNRARAEEPSCCAGASS
jgi:NAD dependent epimerase/dehydratase family enzyme